MSIDNESINPYDNYVSGNINRIDKYCDSLIEQILFYKFIINSNYDESDLLSDAMSSNINKVVNDLKLISKSVSKNHLIEMLDFIEEEDIKLKWKDFQAMEPTKELLREFKIYKLMKKSEKE